MTGRPTSLFLPEGWQDRPPVDHGLLGPDSVTWRIFGSPAVGLGAARAALVQLLYPPVAAGVGQHSDYLEDVHGRTARTLEFAYATTYGDTPMVERVTEVFARVHERISGIEPLSGQPYTAMDPEHRRYVHVTTAHSMLVAYQALGGRLSAEDVRRFLAESRTTGRTAGLDPDDLPGTRDEVAAYLHDMRPRLAVSVQARRLVDGLLAVSGHSDGGALAVLGRSVGLAGAALMPRHLQVLAGVDRNPLVDRYALLPVTTGLLRAAGADPAERWLRLACPTGHAVRRWALAGAASRAPAAA